MKLLGSAREGAGIRSGKKPAVVHDEACLGDCSGLVVRPGRERYPPMAFARLRVRSLSTDMTVTGLRSAGLMKGSGEGALGGDSSDGEGEWREASRARRGVA